jgi:hypothetical protein
VRPIRSGARGRPPPPHLKVIRHLAQALSTALGLAAHLANKATGDLPQLFKMATTYIQSSPGAIKWRPLRTMRSYRWH